MGRGIVQLSNDWYVEWSTVVDAPVSWGMDRDEVEQLIYDTEAEKYYGQTDDPVFKEAIDRAAELRLERLDKKGTTFYLDKDSDSVLSVNRAGKNETHFSREQIIKWYCELQRDPDELGLTWEELEESNEVPALQE